VSVLQGVSGVALLATSAWLISRASEQPPVMYLSIAVVGVRGFALGRASFRYAERLLLHDSAFRMLAQQRPRILAKLIPFSPAGLGNQGRGQLMSRVVGDVDELQNLPLRVLSPLIQSLAVSLVAVVGLSLLLPSAGLTLALCLLGAFLVALPLAGRVSKTSDAQISPVKADFANQSLDLLEHLDLFTAFDWVSNRRANLKNSEANLRSLIIKNSVSTGLGLALLSVLSIMATVTLAYLGAESVANGSNAGVLLAVFALVPMAVFDSVQASAPIVSAWQRFRQSAFRVNQILEREVPVEIVQSEGHAVISSFENLQLIHATASYPGSSLPVLENLSLHLSAGETLALQGASGSGKSTVANILLNFLNLKSGQYLINGLPAEIYRSDSIHERLGYLEQNPLIFMGSVRANLLLARPSASDEELLAVLKRVGIWQMFANREGLETELGERGVFISGGEAQRLALARALLADFQVLILDEPTSSVDQEMGLALVADLLHIAREGSNRAILLITHDGELAKLADRIIAI
jgi:ATP-binding cassette subfamily C protein CydC